jgi:hypothetical protein
MGCLNLMRLIPFQFEFSLYALSMQSYFIHTSNNILACNIIYFKTYDVSHFLNYVATHYLIHV